MPKAKSMTAYARAAAENEAFSVTVTAKSVNHRFLDLKLRSPNELDPLETMIRNRVKRTIQRGQLQLSIDVKFHRGEPTVAVDRALINAYLETYREIAAERGLTAAPDLSQILRAHGAVELLESPLDDAALAELEKLVGEALDRALAELNANREIEGAGLVEDLRGHARAMTEDVDRIDAARASALPLFQERLAKKLSDLLETPAIEPQRILQEAAILADRTDVAEELQRLRAHIERLREIVGQGGEMGKQIDFLAQEMNRETNTILSKSTPLGGSGLAVTECGLRLKAAVEKIREQAQNLE